MRTRYLSLGLYLALSFIPLAAAQDEITWLGDYREALQQAKQTHKPIFLEFRCEA